MKSPALIRQLVLVGATTLLVVASADVHAYTLSGTNWSAYTSVPVYLDAALPSMLIHNDGTQWTQSELEAEIRFNLHLIAQSSEANLPDVYYAGLRTPPCAGGIACLQPNAIVITSFVEAAPLCWDVTYNPGLPPSSGRVVALRSAASPGCSPTPTWEHVSAGTGWPMMRSLMHELGHAIGLAHSFIPGCTSPPCTIMDEGADWYGDWYYRDDINGLRAAYGPVSLGTRVQEESSDGNSWWTLAAPPATGTNFSVSSAPAHTDPLKARMFQVYHDASDGVVRARTWDWWPMVWQNRTSPSPETTPGPLGAAFPTVSMLASQSYLGGETTTNVAKDWRFVRHSADFSASSLYVSAAPPLPRRHGVSAAFDPRTNATVQVWRTTEMELRIGVITGAGAFVNPWPVLDGAGAAVQSFGPPSVACGDASILNNCIVVWSFAAPPGSADDFHTMRWMHFRLDYFLGNWTYTQAPIMASGSILNGPPLVAYKGPSTSISAFIFAGVTDYAGTSHVWTMRKTADATSYPANWGTHGSVLGRRHHAALGAAQGHVELIYARRP